MNPFRWLLDISAKAAQKRGGGGVDPLAFAYAPVDARDDEEYPEVDGAFFFNGNKKVPELWSELSADRSRYARVTAGGDSSCRLSVFERCGREWTAWEGPFVMASLEDAQALARVLMNR